MSAITFHMQPARQSATPLRLSRHEATILYLFSALSAGLGALSLVCGRSQGVHEWFFFSVIVGTYLFGGGTLYLLFHWRDVSWRQQPKIAAVHGFNLLSAITAMPLFGLLAIARLHYNQ